MYLKKVCVMFLTLAMTAGIVSGCGKSTESPVSASGNAEGTVSGSPDKPMEISIGFWDAEIALSDRENDRVLQAVEDKFHVKLVPKNITWDDYTQKIQAWSASDSLPDVFAIDAIGTSYYNDWIRQGVVRAIPEDMSSYPNLNQYLDVSDIQTLKRDGFLYCIPRKTYPDNYWNAVDRSVYYRWDLAQKAGVTKEPETWDEFRDMIKKIIAADPEGKKVAGMTVTQPQMLDGLFFTYSLPAAMSDGSGSDFKWMKKDGEYIPAYFAGDAVSTFQLARDMYQEGTVEADIALAKLQQSCDKFLNGQSAAILAGAVQSQYNRIGKDWGQANDGRDFWDDVKMLKLLPGKDGKVNFSIFRTSWSESYFSSKVDDTKMAKIMEIYDWFCTDEGRELIRFGFEGDDYTISGDKLLTVEGVNVADKYLSSRLGDIVEWNQSLWNDKYPSQAGTDERYREADMKRYNQAKEVGYFPEFDMRITYMSTPLKDKFVIKPTDDLLNVMMGKEPVQDMWNKIMENYENKGLSAMIQEVNAEAEKQGIK